MKKIVCFSVNLYQNQLIVYSYRKVYFSICSKKQILAVYSEKYVEAFS